MKKYKSIVEHAFKINNSIEKLDFTKKLVYIEKIDLNNIEKIELLSYIFLFQSRYKINSQDKEEKEKEYIYHYTKKDTLQTILDSKEFYLSPSFTLNDPEEGTAFYNSIDNLDKNKIINENDNLVFIQSFTKIEDNLPMYIMYTTEEKDNKNQMGYCIGYETSLFRGYDKKINVINTNSTNDNTSKDLKMEDLELVEVFYIGKNDFIDDKKNNKNELKNEIIKEIIKSCKGYIEKENKENKGILEKIIALCEVYIKEKDKEIIEKIIKSCKGYIDKKDKEIYKNLSKVLAPILYIIKNKTYSHEEEIRLIYIARGDSDKKIEEDENNKYCVKTGFNISNDVEDNKPKDILNITCSPKASIEDLGIDKIKMAKAGLNPNIEMSSIKYK